MPQIPRPHSSIVVDGPERAPSRSMLYPVGFRPEDFSKPQIGDWGWWRLSWAWRPLRSARPTP